MKHRSTLPLAPAALTLAVLLAAGAASGQMSAPTPAATTGKTSTAQEAPKCVDCHTELVQAFASNPARAGPARREVPTPTTPAPRATATAPSTWRRGATRA